MSVHMESSTNLFSSANIIFWLWGLEKLMKISYHHRTSSSSSFSIESHFATLKNDLKLLFDFRMGLENLSLLAFSIRILLCNKNLVDMINLINDKDFKSK